MASYGRNFDFRVTPEEYQRRGRIVLDEGSDVPIGAPFIIMDDSTPDVGFTDALPAVLATGAQTPRRGMTGLGVYEWIDLNGHDTALYTYSDQDLIPNGKLFQLVSGPGVKVVFKNTSDRTFMNTRDYTGRIMVAGMGATPTVGIGDFLSPGTGDDTSGYWAVDGNSANAWLRVTNVDALRQEVEAEFMF
ncbi:hypothetical protein [Caudovirales GX15bay]|nr:hypothetical protein [Caudovirales GX15bay]